MTFLSSQHHSFDIALAAKYCIEEAILIHHFQHWIRINRCAGRNVIDGRAWTYQKRSDIAEHFPYLKEEEIRRLCESLVKKKVLMTANHNKSPFDKTLWYAFVNEKEFGVDEENSKKFYERQNCQIATAKLPSLKDTISFTDSLKGSRKAAASCCKESPDAAASSDSEKGTEENSIQSQLPLSKIPKDDWPDTLEYYAQNKAEIDSKDNPMGWLVKMCSLGKHRGAVESKKLSELDERLDNCKWARENLRMLRIKGDIYAETEGVVYTLDGLRRVIVYEDARFKEKVMNLQITLGKIL